MSSYNRLEASAYFLWKASYQARHESDLLRHCGNEHLRMAQLASDERIAARARSLTMSVHNQRDGVVCRNEWWIFAPGEFLAARDRNGTGPEAA